MRASVLWALLAVVACDRPTTRVICHNGNCVEPTDPENDDTIEALRESLALEHRGRPAIDGIEIDTFWRRSDGTCLYAHDLDAERTETANEPAMVLAEHFATATELTYDGGTFEVSIELKSHVEVDKTARHTAEERARHAACSWDVYRILSDAAIANGRDVLVVFSSFSPDVLRAVVDAAPLDTPTPFAYASIYGIPKPLDSQTHPLDDFTGIPISIVEVHDQWLNDAQLEGIRSSGAKLVLWMFSATVETFDAIERYEPSAIVTSEARLMRRWLDD